MKIKIVNSSHHPLPQYATPLSAGLDLRANLDAPITLQPMERRLPDLPGNTLRYARHPLVYLVEAADDICYEIMDIEDAHKLRILSDEQTMQLFLNFFEADEQEKLKNRYATDTDIDDQIVYYRSCVIVAYYLANQANVLSLKHQQCEGK